MNSSNWIFLIGMPGSGKSTVGKQLAEKLSLPFYDLDNLIERHSGRLVTEIFAEEGEGVFRKLEAEVLENLISSQPQGVVSTGGGAPMFYSGIDKMLASGLVAFLDVSIPQLIKRTSGDQSRPLLSSNLEDRLEGLDKERRPVYERAPYHITCGDDEVNSVVNKLLVKLNIN